MPCLDQRLQPAFLAALRRTEADVAALARIARSLPAGLARTRAAVGTRLLAGGGARRDVEPLLAIADLDDLAALLGGLEDVTPPPWLVDLVFKASLDCYGAAGGAGDGAADVELTAETADDPRSMASRSHAFAV